MLDDGTYDTLVIDAEADGAAIALELTIVAGPHKGEVVSVRALHLDRDPLDLMGLPATLTVTSGEPAVVVED
jgi:hypothetical protein